MACSWALLMRGSHAWCLCMRYMLSAETDKYLICKEQCPYLQAGPIGSGNRLHNWAPPAGVNVQEIYKADTKYGSHDGGSCCHRIEFDPRSQGKIHIEDTYTCVIYQKIDQHCALLKVACIRAQIAADPLHM